MRRLIYKFELETSKSGGSRKETVTILLDTSVAQLHAIPLRGYSIEFRVACILIRFLKKNVKVWLDRITISTLIDTL